MKDSSGNTAIYLFSIVVVLVLAVGVLLYYKQSSSESINLGNILTADSQAPYSHGNGN